MKLFKSIATLMAFTSVSYAATALDTDSATLETRTTALAVSRLALVCLELDRPDEFHKSHLISHLTSAITALNSIESAKKSYIKIVETVKSEIQRDNYTSEEEKGNWASRIRTIYTELDNAVPLATKIVTMALIEIDDVRKDLTNGQKLDKKSIKTKLQNAQDALDPLYTTDRTVIDNIESISNTIYNDNWTSQTERNTWSKDLKTLTDELRRAI